MEVKFRGWGGVGLGRGRGGAERGAGVVEEGVEKGGRCLINCNSHPSWHRAWGMGWLEGAPGQYRPPNLILTQSMHLKYTCGKRAVSNSSSLYTLFYSVIYNSVAKNKQLPVQFICF